MHKKKKTTYAVILLAVIAGMLGIILALLPTGQEAAEVATTPSEIEDYTTVVPEQPVTKEPSVVSAEKKPGGEIFIVIDDVGNNLEDLAYFLKLSVPLTFAVMPGRTFSEESARRIREAGFDIILHQPMEPEGDQNPGVGAITADMNRDAIQKVLEKNLAAFPDIKGINNHMGSKVTADEKAMKAVMAYLKEKGMFFLDSVTTNKSVAEKVAVAMDLPFAKRNTMFLDNENEKASIQKAFLSGIDVASAKGTAIMIGHVKSHYLADVIAESAPELEKKGYTFSRISSFFRQGGAP